MERKKRLIMKHERAWVTVTLDKMDTKAKVLYKIKQKFYDNEGSTPSQRYNDYNYIFTYQQNWKSDRIEREIDNSSIMVG